ncbi:hypothetical protein AGR4B_Cc70150 [Agrobacterium tumefaciens str. CFBP 5621]|nr:hypothetical protein AGR4B_Cc70150 [Agrobacterium tumefaciens str. CFBP 5621]
MFLVRTETRLFIRRSCAKSEFACGRSAKRPNRGSLFEKTAGLFFDRDKLIMSMAPKFRACDCHG